MQQHDKIINAAAKKVLAPKGLLEKAHREYGWTITDIL